MTAHEQLQSETRGNRGPAARERLQPRPDEPVIHLLDSGEAHVLPRSHRPGRWPRASTGRSAVRRGRQRVGPLLRQLRENTEKRWVEPNWYAPRFDSVTIEYRNEKPPTAGSDAEANAKT